MHDLLIALAFLAMVGTPALIAMDASEHSSTGKKTGRA